MKKGMVFVLGIVSAFTGAVAGAGIMGKIGKGDTEKIQSMSDKHLSLFLMMNQWVKVKQEGKNLSAYFVKKGYKKIAIYGMSYAGECLVNELENSEITIKYGIDKNADSIYTDIEVVNPEDNLEEVDAVVVTPIFFMSEIEEMLSKKLSCPIISLEDILYEV